MRRRECRVGRTFLRPGCAMIEAPRPSVRIVTRDVPNRRLADVSAIAVGASNPDGIVRTRQCGRVAGAWVILGDRRPVQTTGL